MTNPSLLTCRSSIRSRSPSLSAADASNSASCCNILDWMAASAASVADSCTKAAELARFSACRIGLLVSGRFGCMICILTLCQVRARVQHPTHRYKLMMKANHTFSALLASSRCRSTTRASSAPRSAASAALARAAALARVRSTADRASLTFEIWSRRSCTCSLISAILDSERSGVARLSCGWSSVSSLMGER
jgi:hypothetical protein